MGWLSACYTFRVDDVGRYRVTRRIGEGGMAEVFEGEALGAAGFRRRVAIKRMLRERAFDASFARMFLDEARIASQLHHANIVGVLDYGISDGVPFQVLDFVDGMDAGRLRDAGRAAGSPMPVAIALYIANEIAHALAHAHAAADSDGQPLGIVHRDVSPGNILVAWSGDVKLTDFGIAFAKGRLETTTAGITKGTLLYMAPEQMMRGQMDGRTDVFALGCVLHALLTGASPLSQENAMAELIGGRPLQISPELPDDVYDIVTKATRLSKADRFAGAGEVAEALGAALARRIDRDARTIAREWLERVRGRAGEKRGRLDALLDLELVLASEGDDVREFAVRPAAPAPARPEDDIVPRRRRWPAAAAAIAIVAAATEAALMLASGGRAAADAGAARAAAAPDATAAVVFAPAPDARAPAVVVAPPDAAVVASSPPETHHRPRPPPPRPPSPPDAVAGLSEGVLVIGGEGATKAEIRVDGRLQGYAPLQLHLSVGTHDVELLLANGERRTQRIEVKPTNTPSAPARWLVP